MGEKGNITSDELASVLSSQAGTVTAAVSGAGQSVTSAATAAVSEGGRSLADRAAAFGGTLGNKVVDETLGVASTEAKERLHDRRQPTTPDTTTDPAPDTTVRTDTPPDTGEGSAPDDDGPN